MDLPLLMEQKIRREQLVQQGDHVAVGVSGGADSVCLLLCLHRLAERLGVTVSAVHVNHGIRGAEADGDAEFVRALCRRLQVPLRLAFAEVPRLAREGKMSLEEAGRESRYRIFREERARLEGKTGGRVWIAVAHHRDDQAETVLMNLCRGAGIRGIGGMRPKSGDVIRPLLFFGREEIREWLTSQGETWREDSTNREDDCVRNRVRLHLLPMIAEEINPQAVRHLNEAAEQARELDDWLEREAVTWMKEHAGRSEDHRLTLPAAGLLALPAALRGRILLLAAAEISGGRKDLTAKHIRAAERLLSAQSGKRADFPGGLTAERSYGDLIFVKREEKGAAIADLPYEMRTFFRKKGEKIPRKTYTKWFDYDKINGCVICRTRRTGDYLTLAGVGRKSVSSYMKGVKIPAEMRDQIFLFAVGSHVLWIVGYRMSADVQVTEETGKILEIKVPAPEERI